MCLIMSNIPDELLDIVDAQDAVIGTMWRSQRERPEHWHFRSVFAFLKNSEGKVCILRRSANKSYLPLHWSLVGGCVSSGEDYDVAVVREIAEEINMDVDIATLSYLGHVTPTEFGGRFFTKVYEIRVDSFQINYNPEDFCEYRWIFPHELLELQKTGELIEKKIVHVVQRFYPREK